jgi:hypothetical protein
MSIRPPFPFVRATGTPPIRFRSSIPSRTTRIRPGLSVTSMLPSGRKCEAPGMYKLFGHDCDSNLMLLGSIKYERASPNGGTRTPMGFLLCCKFYSRRDRPILANALPRTLGCNGAVARFWAADRSVSEVHAGCPPLSIAICTLLRRPPTAAAILSIAQKIRPSARRCSLALGKILD